jgi:hypothetical protein
MTKAKLPLAKIAYSPGKAVSPIKQDKSGYSGLFPFPDAGT